MTQFIKSIDFTELAKQKEFLLNHGGKEAMELAHMIDKLEDAAYEVLGDDIKLTPQEKIN